MHSLAPADPVGGPVLAATPAGHTLLDSYSTLLGHGIPLPWRIKTTKKPPSVPFDGLPSGPTSGDPDLPRKRRKTIRNMSQNEQANIDLHEELKEWLPDAVEQVRQAWISTTGVTAWYTQDRLVMVDSTSPEEQQKGIDLVAWGDEVAELNALDRSAEQGSYCSQEFRLQGAQSMSSLQYRTHADGSD